MHTFSPAKMWIAGLDALQQAAAAPAHAGERRAAVGRHRLRLHEPQPGRARRPRVRLHPDAARRRRARPSSATCPTRAVAAAGRRLGSAPPPGWAATRALKLARFGDNMRYVAVTEGDKTEAELRFGVQVNTWGVNELVDGGRRGSRRRHRRARRRVRGPLRRRARAAPGGERHQSLRDGAAIELGLRVVPRGGRVRRVHHQLRGPRRAEAAARPRRAAADGRRATASAPRATGRPPSWCASPT